MVTKAWSATKAIVAISKWKEAATSLSMKNKSKPSSATMASGCCGLTLSTIPKRWLTSNKALWTVADIIRTSKSILETRPIYHKRDATIRGHVFCSFLALLLKQELESRMKRTDLEWEWKEVIRGLDALQQVEANFQSRRFLFRSQLTAQASQAVRASGVAIPPTLREIQ